VGDKVSLKISAAAAPFLTRGATAADKLGAICGEVELPAGDLAVLLLILSQDADPAVKGAAIKRLRELSEDLLLEVVTSPGTHPRVLDVLARLHSTKAAVMSCLALNPNVSAPTISFLAEKGVVLHPQHASVVPVLPASPEPSGDIEDEEAAPLESPEETEEFKSKYQLSRSLGVAERIKIALTGDKEWRSLLIKDSNKLVSGSVVKNPRITEAEILTIARSAIQNEEILRIICMNKEWLKNYQIKKALALNNKTPLPAALRYISTLTEKDLAAIAKSKNVSSVISTQARRILLNKQKH
jgi:hypothetical protein